VSTVGFAAGIGQWAGSADVFDGGGRFVGGGADTRHVQALGDGCVRIDVSFVGPFRHAGHYLIRDYGAHRVYDGPANVGYAECLSDGLVDAHAYWPALGLSQRFFLMVLPDGQTQLSLALMSRGEQLMYAVVGQNHRVGDQSMPPTFVSGTAYDLSADPTCGRGAVLLHRVGCWRGALTVLDGTRQPLGEVQVTETVSRISQGWRALREGGHFVPHSQTELVCDGWQAWTPYAEQTAEVVGSASLYGGRALSGQFYHREAQARVWRREVVTHDGARKAVLNVWSVGGQRVGVEFGVMEFDGR
jgi:hypothetical protein